MRLLFVLLLFLGANVTKGELKHNMSDRKKQVKSFLHNISGVESSGGTNYNHSLIQSGIHSGDTAIGRYGLMPNTVNEVLNRMRMSGTLTPDLKALGAMDHVTLKQTLEANPELEDKIAESLAQRVLTRQPTEDAAAYSWHQGHNLSPDQVSQVPYEDNDYVKKYNEYKNQDTGEE